MALFHRNEADLFNVMNPRRRLDSDVGCELHVVLRPVVACIHELMRTESTLCTYLALVESRVSSDLIALDEIIMLELIRIGQSNVDRNVLHTLQ
jgi:hypothetical protein